MRQGGAIDQTVRNVIAERVTSRMSQPVAATGGSNLRQHHDRNDDPRQAYDEASQLQKMADAL